MKLRFLQSIAIVGLLGCCSGSRELASLGPEKDDGAKAIMELHAKENGRDAKAVELEQHL